MTNERQPAGPSPTRRHVLRAVAGMGVGSAVFQRALAAGAEKSTTVTPEMVRQAEWVAGLTLSDKERRALARDLTEALGEFKAMRAVDLPNGVPPAVSFNPAPWLPPPEATGRGTVEPANAAAAKRPDAAEDLAFLPVT